MTASVFHDRFWVTVSAVASAGMGAFTLGAALAGYLDASILSNGELGSFCAVEGSAWEVFQGTYTSSGTSLARTTRWSSSTGSAVVFTTAATVFEIFGANDIATLVASIAAKVSAGTATGTNATAVGLGSIANGTNATAAGYLANATGADATAVGKGATANGSSAQAFGDSANATGSSAVALGQGALSNGALAVSFGTSAVANGANATAVSTSATASGADASAFGYLSVANGAFATALGRTANATGSTATAVGAQSLANGTDAATFGRGSIANGSGSTALGTNANASFANSTAVGANAAASGANHVAIATASETVDIAGKLVVTGTTKPRMSSSASITSPLAWNSDNFDNYAATALANSLTINADAGTPNNGAVAFFILKDDGTPRTITLTTGSSKSFLGGSILPAGTTPGQTTVFAAKYNASLGRWMVLATTQVS